MFLSKYKVKIIIMRRSQNNKIREEYIAQPMVIVHGIKNKQWCLKLSDLMMDQKEKEKDFRVYLFRH